MVVEALLEHPDFPQENEAELMSIIKEGGLSDYPGKILSILVVKGINDMSQEQTMLKLAKNNDVGAASCMLRRMKKENISEKMGATLIKMLRPGTVKN
jgi:hypothetical protein